MFDAMTLSPVFAFEHAAQFPSPGREQESTLPGVHVRHHLQSVSRLDQRRNRPTDCHINNHRAFSRERILKHLFELVRI